MKEIKRGANVKCMNNQKRIVSCQFFNGLYVEKNGTFNFFVFWVPLPKKNTDSAIPV